MANFSARDIQQLRRLAGVGMLDAKRALEETDGVETEALQWLRVRGLAKSTAREGREASQGAVAAVRQGAQAAIVELRCETDFVAKAPEFVTLVDELAAVVVAQGESALVDRQADVERLRTSLQENISVGRVVRVEGGDGQVVDTYVHQQSGRGVNAVLVLLDGGPQELAHDVAVHIAFARPAYLSRDEVPEADVAAERSTVEQIARNEGKPEAALGKVIEGRMNGWYKERVLLDQPYVKDEKQTVASVLGSHRMIRFAQVMIGS